MTAWSTSLRPLITPNNAIAAVPTGNALVITDYAENLKRIDKIISSLDVPPAGEPDDRAPVKYAPALDMVQVINRLLTDNAGAAGGATGGGDALQRVTLVADPRSNSILIRGDNTSRMARARSLIEQLDTPGRAAGNMFIIYLKNADATRVAQTLRALMNGGGDDRRFTSSTLPDSATAASGPRRPLDPVDSSAHGTVEQRVGSGRYRPAKRRSRPRRRRRVAEQLGFFGRRRHRPGRCR